MIVLILSCLTCLLLGEVKIRRNKRFLPRAFAVHGSKVLQGEKRILTELKDPRFDPREYVILEEAENRAASQSYSEVTVLQAGVDEIELAVEMGDEGFVVLSNQYYPGWRAYVDGKEERIYRANYILMAVPLAEGSHTVKFVYEPAMHQINFLVRIIVPLGLVGVLLHRRYSACRLSLALSPVEVKGQAGGKDEPRGKAL